MISHQRGDLTGVYIYMSTPHVFQIEGNKNQKVKPSQQRQTMGRRLPYVRPLRAPKTALNRRPEDKRQDSSHVACKAKVMRCHKQTFTQSNQDCKISGTSPRAGWPTAGGKITSVFGHGGSNKNTNET